MILKFLFVMVMLQNTGGVIYDYLDVKTELDGKPACLRRLIIFDDIVKSANPQWASVVDYCPVLLTVRRGSCTAVGHLVDNCHNEVLQQFPPMYYLDNYQSCLDTSGRYCTVHLTIVSNTSDNKLYNLIKEYSDFGRKHFNHTKLLYGKCINSFCPEAEKLTKESDLRLTLERCSNKSFIEKYALQTRIESVTCNDNTNIIEWGDIVVAVVLMSIIVLVFVSTMQYFIVSEKKQGVAYRMLSSFSLPRNLKILFAARKAPDIRMEGLSALYGMRALTSMFVFASHSALPFVIGNDKPQKFELVFNYVFKYIAGGTVIVQTFFTISGFLMCYNILLYQEKHSIRAVAVPVKLFLRWLRLTPVVLVVLGITCTWLRFTEYGPLWQTVIGDMISDCRSDWWMVPLFLINYVDGTQCASELWYIAADFHLTVLGLTVVVFLKGRTRLAVLLLLLITGMVVPSFQIYLQDLDLVAVGRIESGRNFYIREPSFNSLYKRTHNNMINFITGMLTAFAVHHWQTKGVELKKYAFLRYLVWATLPAAIAAMLAGSLFFMEGPALGVGYRVLYLVGLRLLWACMICSLLVSFVFGLEKVVSTILSFSVWTVPARLSYVAYIMHISVIRCLSGYSSSLLHITPVSAVLIVLKSTVLAFAMAVPMWLFVEAPMTNLIKCITEQETSTAQVKQGNEDLEKNSPEASKGNGIIFHESYKAIDPDIIF